MALFGVAAGIECGLFFFFLLQSCPRMPSNGRRKTRCVWVRCRAELTGSCRRSFWLLSLRVFCVFSGEVECKVVCSFCVGVYLDVFSFLVRNPGRNQWKSSRCSFSEKSSSSAICRVPPCDGSPGVMVIRLCRSSSTSARIGASSTRLRPHYHLVQSKRTTEISRNFYMSK